MNEKTNSCLDLFLLRQNDKWNKERAKSVQAARETKVVFNKETLDLIAKEKSSSQRRMYEPANYYSRELQSKIKRDFKRLDSEKCRSVEIASRRLGELQNKQFRNKRDILTLKEKEMLKKKEQEVDKFVKKCKNMEIRNYEFPSDNKVV